VIVAISSSATNYFLAQRKNMKHILWIDDQTESGKSILELILTISKQ